MISLTPGVLALLDEGRIIVRGLIKFQFGTGTYGFIKSNQKLNFGGLDYLPGGLLGVSDFNTETGLSAKQFQVSLSASGDDLTPDVLQTIEAEDYRDRPVTIYDAYFHPDTGELLHVQAIMRGYVDTIDHIDTQESGYTIVANCETRSLDYTRSNSRKRSNLDQFRRSAVDDFFFVFASTRGREQFIWGSYPPDGTRKPAS